MKQLWENIRRRKVIFFIWQVNLQQKPFATYYSINIVGCPTPLLLVAACLQVRFKFFYKEYYSDNARVFN